MAAARVLEGAHLPPRVRSCTNSSSSTSSPHSYEDLEKHEAGDMCSLIDCTHHGTQPSVSSLCCPQDKNGKLSWRRDLLIFAIGTLAGIVLLASSSQMAHRHIADFTLVPRSTAVILQPLKRKSGRSQRVLHGGPSKSNHSYAFVQMAYDAPGTPPKYLFQALAMARALQRLSAYPLVLLTNTTHLPDGTNLVDSFSKLNVRRLPVYEVPIPASVKEMLGNGWFIAYWKLQVWRLTQYEKLIWMDTDGILFRSIDWLFARSPMWGQKDNWICDAGDNEQNWLCSGLMLIEPSEETYHGLTKYAATESNKWWTNGDQKLIRGYFENVVHKPVQLLDTTVASFGRCLGKLPNVRYSSPGPWNVPAFVHKSSVSNECFDFDVDAQTATIDGKVVNICTYHPLGPYWRDLFCDAMNIVGANTNATEAFCDDFRWSRTDDIIADAYNAWS